MRKGELASCQISRHGIAASVESDYGALDVADENKFDPAINYFDFCSSCQPNALIPLDQPECLDHHKFDFL